MIIKPNIFLITGNDSAERLYEFDLKSLIEQVVQDSNNNNNELEEDVFKTSQDMEEKLNVRNTKNKKWVAMSMFIDVESVDAIINTHCWVLKTASNWLFWL